MFIYGKYRYTQLSQGEVEQMMDDSRVRHIELNERNNLVKQQSFRLIIFGIFLGQFVSVLSSGTVVVALPNIMASMKMDVNTAQFVVTGFMLAMGIVAPLVAYLGDKFSFKGLFVFALVGFVISSLLSGLSWNSSSLIAFRILQGLCTGVISPAAMTIILQSIEKSRQPMAISLLSSASMMAPALGPTVGGYLTQYFGWRSLFFMNIPIGVLALILAVTLIPKQKGQKNKSLDVSGLITSVTASTFLMIYISMGNTIGWLSGIGVLCLLMGLLSLLIFIWRELTAKTPLLNLRVFKYPSFTLGTIVNCLVNIGLYGGTFLVPIFMINILGATSFTVALLMLPGAILMVITNLVCGKLYHKTQPAWILLSGVVLVTFATLAFTHISLATTYSFIVSGLLLRYAGLGLATPAIINLSMSAIPAGDSGHAAALLNWTRTLFASLAIGVYSSIYAGRTQTHLAVLRASLSQSDVHVQKIAEVSAMNETFLAAAVVMFAAVPVIFLLKMSLTTKLKV